MRKGWIFHFNPTYMDASVDTPKPNEEDKSSSTPSVSGTEQDTGQNHRRSWTDNVISLSIPLGTMVIIVGSWLAPFLGIGVKKFQIVSTAKQDSSNWYITGRVLLRDEGTPVAAHVWAIAVDNWGNSLSPAADSTANGEYKIGPIPVRFSEDTTREATDVTIYATARLRSKDEAQVVKGEESLRLSKFGRIRWTEPSPLVLLSIGLIFVITLIVGLINPERPKPKRTQYFTLALLSFLFTITMIWTIALGLRNVNVSSRQGDVISLGFANIYEGSYVKGLAPEWLFSLTSPSLPAPNEPTSGFGAPLWVVLLAVLGAGIFTISLLVKHVKDPLDYNDPTKFRVRIEELVRHQFYILFSPLGAVFVYQLIVAAGAAGTQVTVAIAILAAGVAINILLDKAVAAVQGVLK
jgi:hypothetical protein